MAYAKKDGVKYKCTFTNGSWKAQVVSTSINGHYVQMSGYVSVSLTLSGLIDRIKGFSKKKLSNMVLNKQPYKLTIRWDGSLSSGAVCASLIELEEVAGEILKSGDVVAIDYAPYYGDMSKITSLGGVRKNPHGWKKGYATCK